MAADGNCDDEFRWRKAQSETLAAQLTSSRASPVDAYMIYVFRYCPAVFYCIPITYFTSAQCRQIQTPFMNALLPKLRINRHVKRAVVWGPARYGGLGLKHMETEQIARTVESLVAHVRANTPTGVSFVIACETYQMLLGVQQHFSLLDPDVCPHRPSMKISKITYIWESLKKIDSYILLPQMWTPMIKNTPCIMDVVTQARARSKGTVKSIRHETVRMINACRLWLKALHIEDLMNDDGTIDADLFNGLRQCETELHFPHQERPPDWVWKIWKDTLHQICILRNPTKMDFTYLPFEIHMKSTLPTIELPENLDPRSPLREIVTRLPPKYQHLLGDIDYPQDDGKALAQAILDRRATLYTDGTVEEGCGAHAWTVRTENDNDDEAVSGAAPTWGDPETISSLRTEHFGVLAALLWTWIVVKKYEITSGSIDGAVDNITVVNRVNEGRRTAEIYPKDALATDRDVWNETMKLLEKIPVNCMLRHVKGHQDDLYKRGFRGPLTRDAFWNVQMDKKAEKARLTTPMPSTTTFASSAAEFVYHDQPVHTKIGSKITKAFLAAPLRQYIQEKEAWTDATFESVDWKAFERAMKKLTIHKRINVAKYVFNWHNTGRQKQLFEDSMAKCEDREPTCVGMCPLDCGESETPQHFLQCTVLHDAKVIHRDFYSILKWLREKKTCPEISAIVEKGLVHWMKYGTQVEIWELEDSHYKEDLEKAIHAQNYIGWHNMLKGRIAWEWGDIQMRHYEEVYEDDVPSYISATWWASKFIRQLLYFSLATWQHRNTFLHNALDAEEKIQDRTAAVEEMATWYAKKNDFPSEDRLNFSRSFIERCTDTTAQIQLWLGKIVDIHRYNMRTTLRGYFSKAP